ncbi:nuclear transcription factor Y subunit B-like [Vicia villosa]|uniref:nuclear transcription factor Y subunit B-like n=1 Tax=Vicia villosa TaxID=3911 RepID=UPI00273C8F87|nr:nuclear transcription factor Y subunit B-like [Vicia villosa]
MKKTLPANGKIAKDAKEILHECVFEFISFIANEASDKCQRQKRKTINDDDLLWALGFEDYIDPLKIYLKIQEVNSISVYCFSIFWYFTLQAFLVPPVRTNENWVLWQCLKGCFEFLLLLYFLLMVTLFL